MSSIASRPESRDLSVGAWLAGLARHTWVQLLVVGLLLFVALERAASATGNINLVPSLICLGAFLGPVVFVAYVYEKAHGVPLPLLMWSFIVGGILGVTAASVAEYRTVLELGGLPTTAIGLAEETSKLIVPLAIFLVARYRREADGLLIGVASGMGFAAFETMGYGLVSLLASRGNIDYVEQVLFTRNVLAPAGHAAWTGLICAALWRARARPSPWSTVAVVLAFVVAVTLHAMWDSSTSRWELLPVALVSFGLLSWRLGAVSRQRASVPAAAPYP
ncbi:MAG TPA: PrsW family glutamic-type intramembrane protease [Solirubrobacteraceae bacterium]